MKTRILFCLGATLGSPPQFQREKHSVRAEAFRFCLAHDFGFFDTSVDVTEAGKLLCHRSEKREVF
jgi:hypothetical protein